MTESTNKSKIPISSNERWAIFGASRGLGFALVKESFLYEPQSLWVSSRKISQNLSTTPYSTSIENPSLFSLDCDLTKEDSLLKVQNSLSFFKPTRIFYCAGGGPFGSFEEKPWHSHLWALNLNLLFPAQFLHMLLSQKNHDFQDLQQILFVGSSIAEENADPGASSYAASKHGLKGLLKSIVDEKTNNHLDIRLYSPGYMDTGMLPKNSRPRQDGSSIADPQKIAHDLLHWALGPRSSTHWYKGNSNGK